MHILEYAMAAALIVSGGGLVYHSVRLARQAEEWERRARLLARARGADKALEALQSKATVVAPAWHAPRAGRETPGRRLRTLVDE